LTTTPSPRALSNALSPSTTPSSPPTLTSLFGLSSGINGAVSDTAAPSSVFVSLSVVVE
jgi:hypothetical protein